MTVKACPFCGCADPEPFHNEKLAGMETVICYACRARGPHTDTEAEAIAAWNARATLTSVLDGERRESAPIERLCVDIADKAVPEYRGSGRSFSCCGHMAKRWQAAYNAAQIALSTLSACPT